MKLGKALLYSVMVLFFYGCRSSLDDKNIKLEDFESFYARFYSDSIFQSNRTYFPLDGEIKSLDNENDTLIISEKWTKARLTNISSKEVLIQHYDNIKWDIAKTDTIITERYWIDNSGFNIKREYKLVNNKWFLTYYDIYNL